MNFYPCQFPLKEYGKATVYTALAAHWLWRVCYSIVECSPLLWPNAWWKQLRGNFAVTHSSQSPIHHGEEGMDEPFSTHPSDQEVDSEASERDQGKITTPKGCSHGPTSPRQAYPLYFRSCPLSSIHQEIHSLVM